MHFKQKTLLTKYEKFGIGILLRILQFYSHARGYSYFHGIGCTHYTLIKTNHQLLTVTLSYISHFEQKLYIFIHTHIHDSYHSTRLNEIIIAAYRYKCTSQTLNMLHEISLHFEIF